MKLQTEGTAGMKALSWQGVWCDPGPEKRPT